MAKSVRLSLIIQAKKADKEAMRKIIEHFMHFINYNSRNANMHIDEDCRQFIIINLIDAVKRFKLRQQN